jgi:hypothetical protein
MMSKQLLFRSAARVLLLTAVTMAEKPEQKKGGSRPLDSEA